MFSFSKMAASENDAAQSTKNIGSASDELNNRTQVADYVFEKDVTTWRSKMIKKTARMERILEDTQALVRLRKKQHRLIEQRLHPNMARDLKVPKYKRALMAPSPTRKERLKYQ